MDTVMETTTSLPEAEGASKEGIRWLQFSKLLRCIGAVVLLSGAAAFAVQRWTGWDSMQRYYAFLAFTGLISIGGLLCTLRLKEMKGARTLFGIAAAFLPAHFLQLGALLYSKVVGVPNIDPFYQLVAPSLGSVALALAVAIPCLAAISFAGFSALARMRAVSLTGVYIFANLALLIPTRDANVVGLIVASVVFVLGMFEARVGRRESSLQTRDGVFVRVMLSAPVVALVTRSLLLYATTPLFISAIAGAIAGLLLLNARSARTKTGCSLAEATALPFAIAASGFATFAFVESLSYGHRLALTNLLGEGLVQLYAIPASLLLVLLSLVTSELGQTYRKLGAWIAVGGTLLSLFVHGGVVASFLCVLVGMAVTAGAFFAEERPLLQAGFVGLGAGVLYQLRYAATLYSMSPWLTLSVTGLVTIIAASYIEKNFPRIIARSRDLRAMFSSWS